MRAWLLRIYRTIGPRKCSSYPIQQPLKRPVEQPDRARAPMSFVFNASRMQRNLTIALTYKWFCVGGEKAGSYASICTVNSYSSMRVCVYNQMVCPSGFLERQKFECLKIVEKTGVNRFITSSHYYGPPEKKNENYSGPEWFLIDGIFFLKCVIRI